MMKVKMFLKVLAARQAHFEYLIRVVSTVCDNVFIRRSVKCSVPWEYTLHILPCTPHPTLTVKAVGCAVQPAPEIRVTAKSEVRGRDQLGAGVTLEIIFAKFIGLITPVLTQSAVITTPDTRPSTHKTSGEGGEANV